MIRSLSTLYLSAIPSKRADKPMVTHGWLAGSLASDAAQVLFPSTLLCRYTRRFVTRNGPMTSASRSIRRNVAIACSGEHTMGSSASLNDVFNKDWHTGPAGEGL